MNLRRSRFLLVSCFLLVASGAFAAGQKETPPAVSSNSLPRQYAAPGNGDATQRQFTIPFASVVKPTSGGHVIKSWTYSVFDADGRLVWSQSEKDTRDRGFFGELFNVGVRPQVQVPDQLAWDGTYRTGDSSKDGTLVPDGYYTCLFSFVDSSGAKAQSSPFTLYVGNKKPGITALGVSFSVFSPQGQRKSIAIEQSGSMEYRWEGSFSDSSGQVVRHFVWENDTGSIENDLTPPAFSWDGTDDAGQFLPDGEYHYTLKGTNHAGATVESKLATPILISEKPGVLLLRASAKVFSPLADTGYPATIDFVPDFGSASGLQEWKLTVAEEQRPDLVAWSTNGTAQLPEKITFAGNDQTGRVLPEGHYLAVISASFESGDTAQSPAVEFQILTTTPHGALSAARTIFGGSGRPSLEGDFKGEPGLTWALDVLDENGTPVRQYPLGSTGQAHFTVQQTDAQGKALVDGSYTLRASTHNVAGLLGQCELKIEKDTRSMPVDFTLSSPALVPGDRTVGVVKITPVLEAIDSVEKMFLAISGPDGRRVFQRTEEGLILFQDWDAKDSQGKDLADGSYRVGLTVDYKNGSESVTQKTLRVDRTYLREPQGRLSVSAPVFGGSHRPFVTIDFQGDTDVRWTLAVMDREGKELRQYPLASDGSSTLEFPAPEDRTSILPDGVYTLKASAVSTGGVQGATTVPVRKDSRAFSASLDASRAVLVPGRGQNGVVRFIPVLDSIESVTALGLAITARDGSKVAGLSREGGIAFWDWDGKDAKGHALGDGAYTATLDVTWNNGSAASASKGVAVDSNYLRQPSGTLGVSDAIFGGEERPSVTIRFKGDAGMAWTLEALDAGGRSIGRRPLGDTGAATLEFPFKDSSSALPDGSYTLTATATSKAGIQGAISALVRKDSRSREVSLDISRQVLVPGKGQNGTVRIIPVAEAADSVTGTTLSVVGPDGNAVNGISREGVIAFWDFDGTGSSGSTLADGPYEVHLSVAYDNGSVSRTGVKITIDSSYLTEPQASLVLSHPVFGGVGRPKAHARFKGDAGLAWGLELQDKTGKTLIRYDLGDTGSKELDIEGVDADGKPIPDGTYLLKASARNAAGVLGTASLPLTRDSRSMKAAIDLSRSVLVPGKEGENTLKITPVLEVLDLIENTTIDITTADGKRVGRKSFAGFIPFWDWDGKDAQGRQLGDGTYQATLSVSYANGTVSTARKELRIDAGYLKEPIGTLTAADTVFGSPGRTGVMVAFKGDAGIPWTLDVLDRDGRAIRTYRLGQSGEGSVEFNGTDDAGNALPDGPYTLKASAVSKAGTPGIALLQLLKDSRQPAASLDLSRSVIVPGKGQNGVVRITPMLSVVDSVVKTEMSIFGPDGRSVAEKSNNGIVTFWDWQGVDAGGKALSNGVYQISLGVSYANGASAQAQDVVKIDSTYLNDQGPLVEMKLSAKTFAPSNPDGATDLTIGIKVTEGVVPVGSWQLQILDPRGKPFRQLSGKGIPPKSIVWDGTSDQGDLVESGEDYQVQLRVSDVQNHVTRKQESVTIDISVIKIAEGRYKIVVSSIQFAGYSSDIFKVKDDLLAKNQFVLRRLANALNKFPGYHISLEGYAVSEYWNDPKAAEREQKTQLIPLSLERAEEVRAVMVLLGVDPGRFSVAGFGAERPIVPNSDLENRWKNRRVEFYLDKT